MVNDVRAIDSPPGNGTGVPSGGPPSTDTTPVEENAWLAQAIRLRGEAYRFAQNRIERDLAVAGRSENDIDPVDAASTNEFDPAPTADYLVENEKMADLMRDLARKGLLAASRK